MVGPLDKGIDERVAVTEYEKKGTKRKPDESPDALAKKAKVTKTFGQTKKEDPTKDRGISSKTAVPSTAPVKAETEKTIHLASTSKALEQPAPSKIAAPFPAYTHPHPAMSGQARTISTIAYFDSGSSSSTSPTPSRAEWRFKPGALDGIEKIFPADVSRIEFDEETPISIAKFLCELLQRIDALPSRKGTSLYGDITSLVRNKNPSEQKENIKRFRELVKLYGIDGTVEQVNTRIFLKRASPAPSTPAPSPSSSSSSLDMTKKLTGDALPKSALEKIPQMTQVVGSITTVESLFGELPKDLQNLVGAYSIQDIIIQSKGKIDKLPKELLERLEGSRKMVDSLELPNCPLTRKEVEQLVKYFPNLTAVKFSHPSINDDCLAPLANLENLRRLELEGCKVTDTTLALMKGKPLERIALGGCNISDVGLACLKGAPLTYLSLPNCTGITDAGLKNFAGASIEHLNLTNCNVTDLGLSYFEKAPVKYLYLHKVYFTDAGLAIMSRLPLVVLDARYSRAGQSVTDTGVTQLLAGCPLLEELHLSGTAMSDKALSGVSKLPNLKHLMLSCCPHITHKAVESILSTTPSLRYLELVGCGSLASSELRRLDARYPKIIATTSDLNQGARGVTMLP